MKVYVINEIGYEYNDEGYNRPEGDAGQPVKAFKNKVNADAECKRLNAEHIENNPLENYDGEITEYYTVTEVDLADNDDLSYETAKQNLIAAKSRAFEAGKKEFTEKSKVLFEKNPGLESFAWTQYTPYFNDGDTCRFSAHIDKPDINGVDGGDIDSGEEWSNVQRTMITVREPSIEYMLQEPVANFLCQFNEREFKKMFGDHTKVTVHRDGTVDTDECSHD